MPIRAVAVIGANFGDEGKGRTVDALSTPQTLVVRFNGGAQAGHTVEANGHRHVFSHFGAGTLAGAKTLLSRFFVCNPIVFANEWVELRTKGFEPEVFVDPRSPLTTPYEVAVNRALERSRGVNRHGSVGVGFGETIEREERGVSLRAGQPVRSRLGGVKDHAAYRLEELGLSQIALVEADQQVPYWLDCLDAFRENTRLQEYWGVIGGATDVVFEGAQGLLLDEFSPFFPHVTRSKTGLANVKSLCFDAGITDLEVVYVSRSYLTRHGAGPLPGENMVLRFDDKTNVHGEFQGSFRFAPLQVDLLKETILRDAALMSGADVCISMTCLDQMGGLIFAHSVEDMTGIPVRYTSHGPQREAFVKRKILNSCRPTSFPRSPIVCTGT